jgi:prepilin-type processing-associated H-X9-DG protein
MSSRHNGGAHVLMADGAVKFVTDSIEAGNSRAGMVFNGGTGGQRPDSRSPYGLWGALGTRGSSETNILVE